MVWKIEAGTVSQRGWLGVVCPEAVARNLPKGLIRQHITQHLTMIIGPRVRTYDQVSPPWSQCLAASVSEAYSGFCSSIRQHLDSSRRVSLASPLGKGPG